MRLVFFGTPEIAVPTLDALVAAGHEIALVVSRPDRPAGRHFEMTTPAVVGAARRHGLPSAQPEKLGVDEFYHRLRALQPVVAVVVAFGRLISPRVLSVPQHGFINLHPSLLPRHRGPSPIQWALVCGDRITGVTTMLLDEGMDTGPILLQRRIEIDAKDTAEQLAPRLAQLGAELMVETLNALEEGTVVARAQPEEGVNVTPMLRRDFAKVDWSMPARQLVNRLRGFTPWPGLYTTFRDGRLKIYGLEEVVPAPEGDPRPGVVLAALPSGIVVRCGRRTAARITELQREGRRRIPADAFLIGERVARGEQFG
jgi:methionyl-tRNA formyltransferase